MFDRSNYEIMAKDIIVAIWKKDDLTVLNNDLLPLFLKYCINPNLWLASRAIDSSRPNSRLLKKALRLAEKDDISTVAHVNAATITDNYWIRPIGSELTYNDVKFSDDYFSNLALKGTYDSFNKAATSKKSRTPELTNVGSFEKCWKLRDGKWWMYKRATHNEMFSELFVYELGCDLGFNMAVYERGNGFIKSLDFTNGAAVNFESASTFMRDNEEYLDVIEALKEIYPEAIPDYIRMIFLDTIVANPDRHTNNFGLLRNTTTGEFIGFAPNYDNNMALISRGYPSQPKASDMMISLFKEVIREYPEYKKYIPVLTEETIRKVLDKINMKVRTQVIIDIVMARYNFIK